ncbi:nuclease domain-containing protein [Bordetella bronchiseptica]|uniref:nuclease domain-containing protein n=1 Tax=Bordetella bronchiseptica TaxID=518 RepID=UPI0004618C81|nr:nuclease domain-containing protein [Bordetella bronchiseptica]KDD42579.1 PF07102 family protein [Bordetella bronchiseptica MBORD901]
MMRRTPLTRKTPMKRGKALRSAVPMMRATPMPPPRAAMKARKKGKKPPKTIYRNPGLLALAEGEKCSLRVPRYCQGGTDSTVACHSNRLRDGKGKGIKAHDWAIAFGCSGCHWFIDQSTAPLELKLSYFIPGMRLTRLRIIAMGKWPEEAERGYQALYGVSA